MMLARKKKHIVFTGKPLNLILFDTFSFNLWVFIDINLNEEIIIKNTDDITFFTWKG